MATTRFIIPPKEAAKMLSNQLIKGFGLPLVKRALVNADELQQGDTPDGMSRFNTPLYGTVFFEKPNYTEFIYSETNKTYTEQSAVLSVPKDIGGVGGVYIEGAIIEVSQTRNIVVTHIQGQNGSVKEFINNNDFNVSIKGYFATDNPDVFPAEQVAALQSYLEAPTSIKTTNKFLNDYFGITDLVCMSFSFNQVEGVRNVQYFTAEFLSDVSFQIQEIKNNAVQN